MKTIDPQAPILVTGATGYVAGRLVEKLLREGHTVHAAVRDPENREKLRYLDGLAESLPGSIRYFKTDLLEPGSYAEAMEGCELVFHTASPFTIDVTDPVKELIEPARLGTRNVLESERQQIELAVKSAYVTLESAQAQVAAAGKEVAQAEEARRIATLRYQEGVGTSVEILDAEANLEEAKTRLNSAVLGLNLALARLDLAVGRDWQGEAGAGCETESAGE